MLYFDLAPVPYRNLYILLQKNRIVGICININIYMYVRTSTSTKYTSTRACMSYAMLCYAMIAFYCHNGNVAMPFNKYWKQKDAVCV